MGLMDDGINRRGNQAAMSKPQCRAVEQSALSRPGRASPVQAVQPDDWKAQLPPNSRQRIVGKIVEALKKYPLFPEHVGLQEINGMAVRFEENVYSAAISQYDYVRKISLRMLTVEMKSQSPTANSLQTNAANVSRNSSDLGINI